MGDLVIGYKVTSNSNNTFQVQMGGIVFSGSLSVDWGDGTTTTETSSTFNHRYSTYKEYEITMSGNITKLGNSVLHNDAQITYIIIPSSVIELGSAPFPENSIIESITFESETPPTANQYTFYYLPTSCKIRVPYNSLSTYINTANYPSSSVYTYEGYGSHDYALSFDESSYFACSGSCTITATLTDNNVAVSGETVTLTGTGSSITATTDSNGVATFNLTSISSDKTLTVTYDEVSDTATLTYNLATLNGSLTCLGKKLASNLTSKGITGVDYTDGLTSLADEILNIQTLDDYEEVELLITYTDTSTETITVLKEKTTS